MAKKDFEEGQTMQHLKNIDDSIGKMEVAGKEHNASDVKEFAAIKQMLVDNTDLSKTAAQSAYAAALRVKQQEDLNAQRHEENKTVITDLSKKIDGLTTSVNGVKVEVAGVKADVKSIRTVSAAFGV